MLMSILLHNKFEMKKNICITGLGVKFVSHLTQEVIATIKKADKLFYLSNEPAMSSWLQREGNNPSSLEDIYFKSENRLDSYQEIANEVLNSLDDFDNVCFAVYGHPTYLNKMTQLIKANADINIDVSILPGISSDSVMFADLGVDPVINGIMQFEATDFLRKSIKPVTTSHLVLWQPGMIGSNGHEESHNNREGMAQLKIHLSKSYKSEHEAVVYVASQYPLRPPKVSNVKIGLLDELDIDKLATIYIPPQLD